MVLLGVINLGLGGSVLSQAALFSFSLGALWTMGSRIASAKLASPGSVYQCSRGRVACDQCRAPFVAVVREFE